MAAVPASAEAGTLQLSVATMKVRGALGVPGPDDVQQMASYFH